MAGLNVVDLDLCILSDHTITSQCTLLMSDKPKRKIWMECSLPFENSNSLPNLIQSIQLNLFIYRMEERVHRTGVLFSDKENRGFSRGQKRHWNWQPYYGPEPVNQFQLICLWRLKSYWGKPNVYKYRIIDIGKTSCADA